MRTRVFIGVGSNVAPEANIAGALARLDNAMALVALSTFYATPALERPADPAFVNGVVEVAGCPAPAELKALLRGIEQAGGRHCRPDRFAPREIDLDLLVYGDVISPELALPYPDATTRRFVAVPLLELAPGLVLPGAGLRLAALAEALPPYPMEPLAELTRALRRRVDGRGQN